MQLLRKKTRCFSWKKIVDRRIGIRENMLRARYLLFTRSEFHSHDCFYNSNCLYKTTTNKQTNKTCFDWLKYVGICFQIRWTAYLLWNWKPFSFPRWKFTNMTKWNGTYRMCVAYSSNIFTGCTIFHGQGSLVYNLTSSLKIRKYIVKYLVISEFLRCLWEQKVFNISSGVFMTPHWLFLEHWNSQRLFWLVQWSRNTQKM